MNPSKVASSWVIRNKQTKQVVLETFNKKLEEKINKSKYEMVSILDHLVELNKQLKTLKESNGT